MKATGSRRKVIVSVDGRGVAGHVGTRLLADVADATGLSRRLHDALALLRQRRRGHGPGRVALDLALMLADGGEAIADLAVLRDQPVLFCKVTSDATAWRVLSTMDEHVLTRTRTARAAAREQAWAQMTARHGRLPAAMAAGHRVEGLVLDLDATIVVCHSDKESATPTWKRTFGYHPLLAFLDNTGEALAGVLRERRAGSNATADHLLVLKQAPAQIPESYRHGSDILVRTDSAGCTQGLLAYIRRLRKKGVRHGSPSASRSPRKSATRSAKPAAGSRRSTRTASCARAPRSARSPASPRPTATRATPGSSSAANDPTPALNCPCSTRWKACATKSSPPIHQPGTGRSSSSRPVTAPTPASRTASAPAKTPASAASRPVFAINQAWLQLALVAIDLIAWTQHLLLNGELAQAEPKKLRYRLLHVAARITRSARRTRVHVAENWPWAGALVNAFTRLAALPQPVT